MAKTRMRLPKDIKTFWLAPHCGPGTLDDKEMCGFCGETHKQCAQEFSDEIREYPDWLHDGSILGDGEDDPEPLVSCGGSGFWCSGCGRFWANNSCGENFQEEHLGADGAELVVKTDKQDVSHVHCVCGKQLMRKRKEN